MKIKLLIVAIGIIALVLIILTIMLSKDNGDKTTKKKLTPTPTISSESLGEAGVGFVINAASQEQEQKSYMVGNLISKLPIKGDNFSMYYSFTTNKFTVYLSPTHKDLADSQLETFLKENGVKKEWIDNLITEDKDITPEP